MSDKISAYEASHVSKYASSFMGRPCLITLKEKLAILINSDWIYSMHWPSGHNKWLAQAKKDANTELFHARKRLSEVEESISILNRIEVLPEDEDQ